MFGSVGFRLVAGLAVIATVTSVMASMYSTSRMLGMMSDMDEVPEVRIGRRLPFGNPPLLVTTAAAIVLTVAFDLTRIAALGAFAYLALDLVIHWGHLRHLRGDTGRERPPRSPRSDWTPPFSGVSVGLPSANDWFVIVAFVLGAALVGGGETLYMRGSVAPRPRPANPEPAVTR